MLISPINGSDDIVMLLMCETKAGNPLAAQQRSCHVVSSVGLGATYDPHTMCTHLLSAAQN
jgi:hypothetical protein